MGGNISSSLPSSPDPFTSNSISDISIDSDSFNKPFFDSINFEETTFRKRLFENFNKNFVYKILKIGSLQWQSVLIDTDLYVELKQSVLANTSKDDITDLIDYCQDNQSISKLIIFYSFNHYDAKNLNSFFKIADFTPLKKSNKSLEIKLTNQYWSLETDETSDLEDSNSDFDSDFSEDLIEF